MADLRRQRRSARKRRATKIAVGTVALGTLAGLGYVGLTSGTASAQYRTALPSTANVSSILSLTGTLAHVSNVTAAFPVSGLVTNVLVEPGTKVTAGQSLATMATAPLEASVLSDEATIAQLEVSIANDQTNVANAASASATATATRTTTTSATKSKATATATKSASGSSGSGSRSGSGSSGSSSAVTKAMANVTKSQRLVTTACNSILSGLAGGGGNGGNGHSHSPSPSTSPSTPSKSHSTPSESPSVTPSGPHTTPSESPSTPSESPSTPSGSPSTPSESPSTPSESPTPSESATTPSASATETTTGTPSTLSVTTPTISLTQLKACTGALTSLQKAETAAAKVLLASATSSTTSGGGSSSKTSSGSTSGGSSQSSGKTATTGTGSSLTGTGTSGTYAANSTKSGGGGNGGGSLTPAAQLIEDQGSLVAAEQTLTTANQNLADATLTAPISGTVAAVTLTKGLVASTSSGVTIIGEGAGRFTSTVTLTQLPSVAVGDAVSVLPIGLSTPLSGTVTNIGLLPASTTSSTPTYPITITVSQGVSKLPEGDRASLTVSTATVKNALTVPASAVTTSSSGVTEVNVLNGSTVTPTKVTLGLVGGGRAQILTGLARDQAVVLANVAEALPSNNSNNLRGLSGGGVGGQFVRTGAGASTRAGG